MKATNMVGLDLSKVGLYKGVKAFKTNWQDMDVSHWNSVDKLNLYTAYLHAKYSLGRVTMGE